MYPLQLCGTMCDKKIEQNNVRTSEENEYKNCGPKVKVIVIGPLE